MAANPDPIVVEVVVSEEATAGHYALLDVRMPAGAALAPHVVERETVDVLVLAGALDVVLDGARHRLVGGGHLRLPPAVPRSVAAAEAVRALCLATPAGLGRLAAVVADPSLAPDDRAALLAAAGVRRLPRRLWGL